MVVLESVSFYKTKNFHFNTTCATLLRSHKPQELQRHYYACGFIVNRQIWCNKISLNVVKSEMYQQEFAFRPLSNSFLLYPSFKTLSRKYYSNTIIFYQKLVLNTTVVLTCYVKSHRVSAI